MQQFQDSTSPGVDSILLFAGIIASVQGGTDGRDLLVIIRFSRFLGQILGDQPLIQIFGGKLDLLIYC